MTGPLAVALGVCGIALLATFGGVDAGGWGVLAICFFALALLGCSAWLLFRLLRLHLYYHSFGWSEEAQETLDGQFKDIERSAEETGSEAYRSAVGDCVEALSERYGAEPADLAVLREISRAMKSMQNPHSQVRFEPLEAYELRWDRHSCVFCVFQYETWVRSGGYRYRDSFVRPMTMVQLPLGLGRISIRPEGLLEKMSQMIESREVDLPEYPRFSQKYYLLAEDPGRLKRELPPALCEAAAQHDGLFLQIDDRTLLAMKDEALNPKAALELAEFSFDLLGRLR